MRKVSVITSVYNSELYLPSFLDSVNEQSCASQIELMLRMNDPTEKELSVVEKFATNFPGKLVVSQTKLEPVSASMNWCVNNSEADLLCIWNVDDLRTPNSILSQATVMEQGVDFAYGPYIVVSEFGQKVGRCVDVGQYKLIRFRRDMKLGPFMMFTRDALNAVGPFDEGLRITSDFDFAMRLTRFGRGASTDSILGYYLNAGNGLSTSSKLMSIHENERQIIFARYGIWEKLDCEFSNFQPVEIAPTSPLARLWMHQIWRRLPVPGRLPLRYRLEAALFRLATFLWLATKRFRRL